MDTEPTLIDQRLLLEVSSILRQWNKKEKPGSKEITDKDAGRVAEMLVSSSDVATALHASLELERVVAEKKLFDFISGCARRIEWGPGMHALLGAIWASAYERCDQTCQLEMMHDFVHHPGFFTGLRCMPWLLKTASIPPRRIGDWLMEIHARLENDGSREEIWIALYNLAVHKTQVALELIQVWTHTRPTEAIVGMAGSLLGRLRALDPKITTSLDDALENHQDERRRLLYFRSWTIYDGFATVESVKYQQIVQQMSEGSPSEFEEALHFIRCTLPAPHRDDASFAFGLAWIKTHLPSCPNESWTHWIISLAKTCDSRALSLGAGPIRLLIPGVIPIKRGNEGTWRTLEELLIQLLPSERSAFEDLLFAIAEGDQEGLIAQLSESEGFGRLLGVIRHNEPELLVCKAFRCSKEEIRCLGFALFRRLGTTELPAAELSQWPDKWIAILLFQFQLEEMCDEAIPRFLLALLPRIHIGSEDLKRVFSDELQYQMKNFPGICLDPLGEHDDALIMKAVEAAKAYFENLKACHHSPINSMQVSGFLRACRIHQEKQARLISEARRASPLLSLMSTSYTLYGLKQWQTFINGGLGQVSNMSKFSTQMEVSRLRAIDPDGVAKRRHRARIDMNSLISQGEVEQP